MVRALELVVATPTRRICVLTNPSFLVGFIVGAIGGALACVLIC